MHAIKEMFSPKTDSQKMLEPQVRQKPRLADSDDSYQRSPPDSTSVRPSRRVAVAATKWPLVRRHWPQWQLITGRSGPRTSYRTAPQRQPPVTVTEPGSGLILPPYTKRPTWTTLHQIDYSDCGALCGIGHLRNSSTTSLKNALKATINSRRESV